MSDQDKPQPEKTINVQDKLVETQHEIHIGGQSITYSVTCGTLVLKEEQYKPADAKAEQKSEPTPEKPKAAIFFTAYTRSDAGEQGTRPVSFVFNGGPGSSSVWLHMGVIGPQRVWMDAEGNPPPPPYRLEPNAYSLLDVSDLVFIDPVSTGFSRPAPGEDPKQFHGFRKDIETVGDFIHLYLSRYQRWQSPKYLIGESYGTTRAAGLSGYLQQRHGIFLNGIVLVSSVLNFQTLEFELGNDLPYILFLPTYTATAWYHQRLPKDLQTNLKHALRESEAFAAGDYAHALFQGSALAPAKRRQVAAKLARLTGLSAEFIERVNLRPEIFRFTKELLRGEQRTVGRLDSRFTGFDRDAAGEHFEFDPSMAAITGPYTACFNHYVRAVLKFESDLPYEILNPKVWPWSYAEHENRYVEVAETLRSAMAHNPALKVIVLNGYYDLATPYFATQYTFDHLGLDPSLAGNLSMKYYPAGHMMYIHQPSLIQMKQDLAEFYTAPSGSGFQAVRPLP